MFTKGSEVTFSLEISLLQNRNTYIDAFLATYMYIHISTSNVLGWVISIWYRRIKCLFKQGTCVLTDGILI